jgi:hypothetical protein
LSLSFGQVLMKIVRPMSLFAQRLEIRSLGAGHGLIAAHPIVRVFLGVRAGVGFGLSIAAS